MGDRKQPAAGRELSLDPPGQLPTVSGTLTGTASPVTPENSATPASYPTVQPSTSPLGFLGPPVVPMPPMTDGTTPMPVVERPAANVGLPPVNMPPAVAELERPTTQSPFQPSVKDHRAIEYDPSYWSQPWPERTH